MDKLNVATLRRGQRVPLEIASLTHEGQGVARLDGYVVFVRGALPGDQAEVELTKIRRSFAEGQAVNIVRQSPWRVPARCEHFGQTGGCLVQDLAYDKQLEYKTEQVREALTHIGGLNVEVLPTLGMADPWRYRNKMEYAFGQAGPVPYLGLMRKGSFDEVVPGVDCQLAGERTVAAARLAEDYARHARLPAFAPRTQAGAARTLVVRESLRSGDLMVNLVTTAAAAPDPALVSALAPAMPSTVLWTINNSMGAAVQADRLEVLSGNGEISERIGHLLLWLGPFSFLQTNTHMAEVLYAEVDKAAGLTGSETVLDLYCGVGSIGLYLARRAKNVIGVEAVTEAIAYARRNAQENSIANAGFECARAEELTSLSYGAMHPDLVVVDPPRAGLHPRLLATLRDLRAAHIVYVSCNPAALARDLKALADIYRIGGVQPVDMFPHTWHIEAVVRLQIKEGPAL